MNTSIFSAIIAVALLFDGAGGFQSDAKPPAWQALAHEAAQLSTEIYRPPEVAYGTPDLPNPSLGVGLAGVTDFATQLPFLDLMKTARPWTGHVGTQWGGMDYAALRDGGFLDENGWPTAIPPGVVGISTLVLTDFPVGATSANGRYRLRYEGEGRLEIFSLGEKYLAAPGEDWISAKMGPGRAVIVTILDTDPHKTGNYLRNFTIVKEDNLTSFDSGQVFNPTWIEKIKDFRLLRFMDWMATNNSLQSNWNNRPKLDDFTYGNYGVPLEVMIDLANDVGADPWFNIPHLADDNYIRQFATMVHDRLDPELKAHVELSNEVWNWQFDQAKWAEQKGLERWGQESKWVQLYAMRASQMAEIWDDIYGPDADAHLVKIIATHTGWQGLEEDILNAPLWVAEASTNKPPHSFFDAYAVTGYFGGALGGSKADAVRGWIAESRAAAEAEAKALPADVQSQYIADHQFDLATDLAARELQDGSITGNPEGTLQSVIGETFPYQAAVAQKYGLSLIMYEGGTHIVGLEQNVDDEDLTEFFTAFNYSTEMAELYAELMDGWKKSGGTVFNVFGDIYPPSKWGSWGALRHLDDDNPRWDEIMRFNADNPGWWEDREDRTFVTKTERDVIAPAT